MLKNYIKRVIVWLMTFIVILSSVSISVNAEETIGPTGGSREVVLVLDSSGSMRNTPITAMKTSAIKFCENLMNAEGSNKVAIVVYSTNVNKTLDFTTDIEEIKKFINSMTASGGTNMYAGFEKAKSLLDASKGNSIKNIVMLTDGLPENGPSTAMGRYNGIGPSSSYMYGNYVYTYFDENLKDNYNVYTLGFFHSLSGRNLTYAEKLLNDIQNKGFYEVTNPEDLVFTFGDVAADIVDTDEESDCPIIIVPGVMGSQLYDSGMDLVWPSTGRIVNPFYRLSSQMAISEYLKVKNYNYGTSGKEDPIDQSVLSKGNREYGAQDIYQELVDGIIDEFTDSTGNCTRSVYFFSYDFRRSNDDSAAELSAFISAVLYNNPGHYKVDIVAHSMGGLVVSDYVSDFGSNNIRKVITCGTPYEGAPKLVNSVLTTEVLDSGVTNFALWAFGGLTKETKAAYPALAELAPTERYFNAHSSDFYQYTGKTWTSPFSYQKNYKNITLQEYNSVNNIIFGITNATNATSFHTGIRCASGYNVLASLSNSYFIVGINQKTISGIKYNDGTNLSKIDVDDVVYETKGDGTVPYASSTMISQLENLPESRFIKVETTHTGAAGTGNEPNSDVALANICDILADRTNAPTTSELKNEGYIVIKIACPVDVTIEHEGETLCSDKENLQTYTSYGVLDMFGQNLDVKTMCLDVDNYEIFMNGTGDGIMDYTIRYFNANEELEAEYEFNEVAITPNTIITTNTDKKNIVLNVDEDGDGTVDCVLTPGLCEGNGHVVKNSATSLTYVNDDYDVNYEVVSEYGNNYNVDVIITNKSSETIHNWKLVYDSTNTVESIWNGCFETGDGYSTVTNAGYNHDIEPGASVSFGFIAVKQDIIDYPEKFRIVTENVDVQEIEFETSFDITSDWGSGYNACVTITNISDHDLNDWTLSFNCDEEIGNLWNGIMISHENGNYVIQNAKYNHSIKPGESVTVEFIVPNRMTENEPSDFKLFTIN